MRNIPGSQFNDYDEYNQPTEPMSPIILSPPVDAGAPTYPVGASYGQQSVPAPVPPEMPFPQNAQSFNSYQQPLETPRSYPVLSPSSPAARNGRPPGGAAPFDERLFPQAAYAPQSPVPSIVGASFVALQVLLLLRVVLLLFEVSANSNILVGLVYAVGTLFAGPFQLALDHLKFSSQTGTAWISYVAALIAILAYGVLARILVRFLKALLQSR